MCDENYEDEDGIWEDGWMIIILCLKDEPQDNSIAFDSAEKPEPLNPENTQEPWKSMMAKIGHFDMMGSGMYRTHERLTRDEIYSAFTPFKRGEDYLLLRNRWIAPEDYSLEDAW